MYSYRDLEQLSGVSYPLLAQWKHRGIIDGEGRPLLFTKEMAFRAVWLATLTRAHIPLDEANELFEKAVKRAAKDPGVVMLLTHEGPKFFSNETHFKRLWELVREEGAVIHVISVGLLFVEVESELEAMEKARDVRKHVDLREPGLIRAVK
jgi:hypothetical protein